MNKMRDSCCILFGLVESLIETWLIFALRESLRILVKHTWLLTMLGVIVRIFKDLNMVIISWSECFLPLRNFNSRLFYLDLIWKLWRVWRCWWSLRRFVALWGVIEHVSLNCSIYQIVGVKIDRMTHVSQGTGSIFLELLYQSCSLWISEISSLLWWSLRKDLMMIARKLLRFHQVCVELIFYLLLEVWWIIFKR